MNYIDIINNVDFVIFNYIGFELISFGFMID